MAKTGTVKWFNPTKGFGFIEVEDGGKDVFVGVRLPPDPSVFPPRADHPSELIDLVS